MREIRYGPRQYYKGSFFIIFYDKTDEIPLHIFDNVREILNYQKKELTRHNINQINVELYRALKSGNHFTRFLTGKLMRVYIINLKED